MRSLVEVTWDERNKDDETITKKGNFWLLHFGLKYGWFDTDHGRIPYNFTVAICEDYETRQIVCFMPEQLRFIGTDIKKINGNTSRNIG